MEMSVFLILFVGSFLPSSVPDRQLQLFIFILRFERPEQEPAGTCSAGARFEPKDLVPRRRAMMIIKINCSQITRSNSVRFMVELSVKSRSSHFPRAWAHNSARSDQQPALESSSLFWFDCFYEDR